MNIPLNPGRACAGAALALAVFGWSASTMAAEPRTGRAVVEATCAKCHVSGVDGAPRIGDTAEWSKRVSNGLAQATGNAIEGIRKMPPHGGDPTLTDLEISRAVAYMVSSGHSADPKEAFGKTGLRDGETVVSQTCQRCHASGAQGAPKIGDMAAWRPRLQKGFDALVASAVQGHNKMPSRGGAAGLSDAEIRAAVIYMVVQGAAGPR